MQIIKIADKRDYLLKHKVPEDIANYALSISPKYSIWIARELMKFKQKYPQKTKESPSVIFSPYYLKNILDWVQAKNPDVMKYTMDQANKESINWHEELKEQESTVAYKTHNVVFHFGAGWEIVKLSGGDCKAEGELMGHCVGGYSESVASGKTNIFSLRDPKNQPHVTIEANIEKSKELEKGWNPKQPKLFFEIIQIQGKENKEPITEYKELIKHWFDSLKSKYNVTMSEDDFDASITGANLTEFEQINEYGILMNLPGIGGSESEYKENIEEIEGDAAHSSYFNMRVAKDNCNALLDYAIQRSQLDLLEKGLASYEEEVNERFNEWSMDAGLTHPYPDEKDFMIYPDETSQQLEFGEAYFKGTPKLDQKAYDEAFKLHDEEIRELEATFEPQQLANYLYQKIQLAKEPKQVKQETSPKNKNNIEMAAKSKTKIYKIAQNTAKEVPKPEVIATYVESLKMYQKDNPKLDKEYIRLIEKLPAPQQIKREFSTEECKILYETVGYLWRKITGQDIITEINTKHGPETLLGNYWMIKNGVLLQGVNHFSVVKQNASLFSTLLNLNGFALQQYLSSPPQKLIRYIIENGGMRIFVDKGLNAYFQMSEETYAKWGRAKVKGLDFKKKIVKIIDFKVPYKGWKNGISIRL